MTVAPNWQSIQAEVMRRISEREWRPGMLIPGEVELAEEFGCARATVNRALRQVAELGYLDRKRKAGTRVALHPVRKAVLTIPLIRLEIEQAGCRYSHRLLHQAVELPPALIRSKMQLPSDQTVFHIITLHFSDDRPFVYEDRWINLAVVPEASDADFTLINANEWLVQNAPLTKGDIDFTAANLTDEQAEGLAAKPQQAVLAVNRLTWNGPSAITSVKLLYRPGYAMKTSL